MFDKDGYLTELASGVFQAHEWGLTAYEAAQYLGEDPKVIAEMMDRFETGNW